MNFLDCLHASLLSRLEESDLIIVQSPYSIAQPISLWPLDGSYEWGQDPLSMSCWSYIFDGGDEHMYMHW